MSAATMEKSLVQEALENPQTEREFVLVKLVRYQAKKIESLEGEMGKRWSANQRLNRFYRGFVVRPFCLANGDHGQRAEDAQHEMWKARFLPSLVGSTTKLSTADFKLFIDRCIQDAAEFGVVIYWPTELQDL